MRYEEIEVKSNVIYDGKILKLKVDDILTPDGKIATREYVEHRGGAGVLAVDNDGFILGNKLVGEVDHYVLRFKSVLKRLYIYVCNRYVCFNRKGSCRSCRLTREDRRGNYSENVPAVARTVSASARGDHVGITPSCEGAEGYL